MKTDDLIALLAAGPVAVDGNAARRRFALAVSGGLVGALVLMFGLLGTNPQLGSYMLLPMHWLKMAFAMILAAGGLVAAVRLATPGVRLRWVPAVLAMPVLVVGLLAAAVLLGAEPAQRPRLLFGSTWAVCPLSIAVLSLPAFLLAFWAMQSLAPTRLRLAGAAAGLLAGALGATAYTLHCPELAAPFIAIWYLLGVLIPTGVGALIGPRVLRW